MQDLVRGTLAEVSKLELQEMGQLVRAFKLKVHKPQEGVQKMAHFTWALDHSHCAADDLNATIHSLFKNAGGTRLTGAAPRGPLEREISRLLQGKGKGKEKA
ncbi:unnamed protein product [Prorocentrum cordatum]|uniref:Uncharacterized protein n=1 Tax=Prorocentrum cordatum TaxID=2364126 RepID=A0ABN9X314_9DINO|nr:unnamed protein product [Polarella glacialis]